MDSNGVSTFITCNNGKNARITTRVSIFFCYFGHACRPAAPRPLLPMYNRCPSCGEDALGLQGGGIGRLLPSSRRGDSGMKEKRRRGRATKRNPAAPWYMSPRTLLPEQGAFFGCQIHGVAFLHTESVNEFGDVGQGDVHAVLGQGVDVHLGELQDGFRTDVGCPHGGVG